MKIIVLGYMGSGKSTVGKKLSNTLDIPFVDLDNYIEEKLQKSISEIFKTDGEIFFRLKEHEFLKELLNNEKDFVLSLGGGTPCYAGNMDIINNAEDSLSIYLRTSVSEIASRLQKEKESRPLIAKLSDNELHEFTAKHLFERSFFYEQAEIKVTTHDKTQEKLITELVAILSKQ
ncbi:shikimate kinase [Tenacibaculum agarivorans]|uniref:shikimate kinase n=1 Tax=Tenacibaculum agarivorans TaxID=1908389 RepID=UPI00094BA3D4|nr:shikimate kinase [Tenacibaculum agarivorans]